MAEGKPTGTTGNAFVQMANAPMSGDLDAIRERGFLRVLVVPNKTHYLVDRGRQYGIAFELVREFERDLNSQKIGKGQKLNRAKVRNLTAVFIPVHRNEIFQRLSEGRGDIAVANLTDTPERERLVDFSAPYLTGVNEIVAASRTALPLNALDDLSGRSVYLRASSSFYNHLKKVNQDFMQRGLQPIRIVAADEHLEAEDLMEMLNSGLIDYTIVDSHIAEFWMQIFPKVRFYPELSIASDQSIAWGIRKNTPQLQSRVNAFMDQHKVGTLIGSTVFKRYLANTKWAKNALADKELIRFNRTIAFFRAYAGRYDFDPLMLAAQGYQESGLDQQRKSRVGAIGVMQLMPATGKYLRVGDIHQEEFNIHGGAKYMRMLIDTYFNEAGIDTFNRTLFAFAAYNAGPGRIARLRSEAEKRGLDPNVWFHNVEIVAGEKIGRETVQYVSNISKYYIAYRLLQEQGTNAMLSESP